MLPPRRRPRSPLRLGSVPLAQALGLALLAAAGRTANAQDDVARWLAAQQESLVELYRDFHRQPELSFQEKATAARYAAELESAGFAVTRGVGGHGVVGVLANGDGTVGMLRADMDALPIAEQTGLPFAAPHAGTAADGRPVGVMHACGHDLHMTCAIAVARWFAAHRDAWRGTLVVIGQPAEERAGGAKAMLAAGLFEKFPKPAFALALHTSADLEAGVIGVRPGAAMANVDSCDVTLLGKGGHGASPHLAVDPIVMAAQLVLDLQTIVTRELDPVETAVLTVGAIQGGSKHNVIDDRCSLQITIRSFTPAVRERMKSAIVRKAEAVARSHRAPDPVVAFSESTDALRNDAALTEKVAAAARTVVGAERVVEVPPATSAEDFGKFGEAGVPLCMFRLGTIAKDRLERLRAAGELPPLHNARYFPDVEPSLDAGARTLIAALRALLAR